MVWGTGFVSAGFFLGSICLPAARLAQMIAHWAAPYLRAVQDDLQLSDDVWSGIILGPLLSIIGSLLWELSQLLWIGDWNPAQGRRRILGKLAGPMYGTLLEAMQNQAQIMVTLAWGKVYVGIATDLPEAADATASRGSVRLLPALSGYRHKETRTVEFTDNYVSALTEWRKRLLDMAAAEGSEPENTEIDYTVTIRYQDIETVRGFNPGLYQSFEESGREQNA
ncbi:MAG: hypothetical protein K0U79_06170 [Gammaproteobacteria bacterium]|nr:hypothetical protein [Gammaproteobacteria bacterium]